MALITELRTIATKAESVAGTAEALASADCNIRLNEFNLSLDVPMDQSPAKYLTGDFGLGEGVPGPQMAKFSFTNRFVGKTAGAEPNWFKLAKTAGLHVSGYNASLGSGYILFPTPLAVGSGLTIGVYDTDGGIVSSGWYYKGAGGVGNCTISTEGAGKPYKMAWEYTCAIDTVGRIAKASIPVLTGADTEIPDTFVSGYMTASGTAGNISGCISTMTFNFGNTVSPVECQSSNTGYSQFIITKMEPTLEINPLVNLNYDFWTKFKSGTVESIAISTRQFVLYIPRAQMQAAQPTDQDGTQRVTLTFTPLRPTTAESIAGFAPWYIVLRNIY